MNVFTRTKDHGVPCLLLAGTRTWALNVPGKNKRTYTTRGRPPNGKGGTKRSAIPSPPDRKLGTNFTVHQEYVFEECFDILQPLPDFYEEDTCSDDFE